ncbi:MAG TPA: hypothetical protein PK522_00955 [Nitrosomonas sp.]|nr:hypothetical protein [Nitrosomonas sp.]
MAIFGNIELEDIVQVNDKTRLNCVKSFVSKDEAAISLVRIKPEASGSFIQVGTTNQKEYYLDWEYSTPGNKTVTLEITTNETAQTFTKNIMVVNAASDKLLSCDANLIAIEPDILKWVPIGRNSFLNVHRKALDLILDWLDSIRVWRDDGTKLTKEDISYTDDLNKLSTYITLELIFMGISNKVDDVFLNKAREYRNKAQEMKNRGRIQADLNGDQELDKAENVDMRSFDLVRR